MRPLNLSYAEFLKWTQFICVSGSVCLLCMEVCLKKVTWWADQEHSDLGLGCLQIVVAYGLNFQLDSALKRLHTDENNRQTTTLSQHIMSSTSALDLLKILGFHFQAKGATLKDPYVVYPHWNKDELLIPTYDALRAVLGEWNNYFNKPDRKLQSTR